MFSSKELRVLKLLIDNSSKGLYGSEIVSLSEGEISRASVYTLLERMVRKGFIREVEEAPTQELGLKRVRHFITAEGRNRLAEFRSLYTSIFDVELRGAF